MPARERRPGYRPDDLLADLRARIEKEIVDAEASDDVETVRRTSALIAGLDAELARAAEARMAAVGRLREQGWSYDRLASATGLSKSRIQQLSGEAAGRKGKPRG